MKNSIPFLLEIIGLILFILIISSCKHDIPVNNFSNHITAASVNN